MNNITASKKIHSIQDARNLAQKRMPKLMFDFVDGASGDEKLCEINTKALDQIRLEPKVLRNVENRILKKNGKLIIFEPNCSILLQKLMYLQLLIYVDPLLVLNLIIYYINK